MEDSACILAERLKNSSLATLDPIGSIDAITDTADILERPVLLKHFEEFFIR